MRASPDPKALRTGRDAGAAGQRPLRRGDRAHGRAGAGSTARSCSAHLAADELVAGLLVLHGVHPESLRDRVEGALASVRPMLRATAATSSCSTSTRRWARCGCACWAAATAARRRRPRSSTRSSGPSTTPRPRSASSTWTSPRAPATPGGSVPIALGPQAHLRRLPVRAGRATADGRRRGAAGGPRPDPRAAGAAAPRDPASAARCAARTWPTSTATWSTSTPAR